MQRLLFDFLFFSLGGTVGVVAMCILQAGRQSDRKMMELKGEKNISKNKVCEACNLQRTQLNNYCKNKVTRIDFSILAKLCEYLDCTPNDILKLK